MASKIKRKYESKYFDYKKDYRDLDLRSNPLLYQIGKGEQGVLMVEPYKSEILPYWRFKTPSIAKESSDKIYGLFLDYKKNGDFVGMDMARKFLQMGYTRSRRYANHQGGRKYSQNPQYEKTLEKEKAARKKYILPQEKDCLTNEKAKSAQIFLEKYLLAKDDKEYQQMKEVHIRKQKDYIQNLKNEVDNDESKDESDDSNNSIKKEDESKMEWSSKKEGMKGRENNNSKRIKKEEKITNYFNAK